MAGTKSIAGSILGNRVVRTEDPGLLTGTNRYLADLVDRPGPTGDRAVDALLGDALHAVFVRSDVAHGVLRSIDTSEALTAPGVVAVWTAADLDIAPHHSFAKIHEAYARPPLAVDRVRFVGEAVAVVFATSRAAGVDAAQAVVVDIDPLPAVTDPESALDPSAPTLHADRSDNLAVADAPDAPIDLDAVSDLVVRARLVNQRIAVAPMEPHACAAAPGPDGRIVVWAANQFPHVTRLGLAAATGIERDRIRFVTPQVGGGFGGKAGLQHEYTVVTVAADRLRRPVVWLPSRSEDLIAKDHSRGQVQYVELGCRDDGTFTGLRARIVGDGGAYPGIGAMLPSGTRRMSPGTYAFPAIDVTVAVATTNTPPTGAYRGAGRPEATAMLERIVDHAARELGIDPIELRRRNLLTDDVFPYTSHTGNVYDSGRYGLPLEIAAEAIGYDALRAEQAARRAREDVVQLGIGVASYVEITAGGNADEYGRVEIDETGGATMYCGTLSHGQGHQTTYAMLVSEQTGIPIERIRLVDGDTDLVPRGGGTGGSRSLQIGGSAIHEATTALVERARQLAARVLEADPTDIVVDTATGTVGVAGVPAAALSWADLARRSIELDDEPLTADTVFRGDGASFPFGAHISVVEVDTETGRVRVVRHVAVDDCGTIVNRLLVEGQQHGGIASGIGQALFEEVRFADGNPITSNLADYAMPSAAEMPGFEVHSTETPSPHNPLGAKGIGEAATIGSTPAVQNAVIDALAHLGVRHVDMPCTPERVWAAISAGRDDPWIEPPAVFDLIAARRSSHGDETVDTADADGI
ncbi:MAG: xanthine dehydrogenase family protein molybdopterin-binding subunit [Ilumatobacteraceae bacterium]